MWCLICSTTLGPGGSNGLARLRNNDSTDERSVACRGSVMVSQPQCASRPGRSVIAAGVDSRVGSFSSRVITGSASGRNDAGTTENA